MADLMTAIYDRLTGHAGTGALIASRCYPEVLPQKPTLPAIRYQEVGAPSISDGSANLFRVTVQIDSFGVTHASAAAVRVQAKAALAGYTNKASGVGLIRALNDGGFTDYEPETALYRASFDVVAIVCE